MSIRREELDSSVDAEQARNNRIKLLVLILIPFTLMALAWVVFYTGIGMPSGTSNKGLLINPPLQLNDLVMQGAPPIATAENTQWFFVIPGEGSCNDACEQRLYLTRQIRTALGKHTEKIQRVYLIDQADKPSGDLQSLLNREHADLKVVAVSKAAFKELLLSHPQAAQTAAEQGYYLADFRGFMMMYYGQQHTYKDTISDVKYLLKYAP